MQGGGYSPDAGYGLTSATTTTAATGTQAPVAGDSTPLHSSGDVADLSHLDSFFATTGWTREDVLVVAATVQLVMWVALLYLEVQDG